MTTFQTEQAVEWGDCDAAGIVFYPHFYRWMDGHFHRFAMALGFDQRTITGKYGLWGTPLRDTGCTFHTPATFGDRLTISSHLTALGTTSLALSYRFTRDGQRIAEGREVRVVVRRRADGSGIEKAPIPDEIRTALEIYLPAE